MVSYFKLGFGAYLTNLSMGVLLYLLLVKLFDIFFNRKFSPGWKYTIALAMAAFFLIPGRIYAPWSVIPLKNLNELLYITSPDPILLEGITEVKGYFTGSAEGEYLYSLLFYLWAAGAAVTFAYQMIRLAGLYRAVRKGGISCAAPMYKGMLEKVCREVKVKIPPLIIYPETDTPFAMGIIFPKIILPAGGYSEKEIEYIFRHEVRHIKRKDILIKLLLIIFRCINWFNPLVYIMVGNAFSDMEISCDEKTSENFSPGEREEYSKTLLKGASGMKYPAVTTYLSPTARLIKKRIDAVMNIRKFGKAIPFTVAFVSIVFLSQTFYALPDEKQYDMYVYIAPYPMEADPYITSEEWKTAEGSSAEEAGEKIFRQYMEMYMGDDVPEYYRIKEYVLEDIHSYDKSMKFATKGILTSHDFVGFGYSFIPANECGNTVHNKNFGGDFHLNGVYNDCEMAFELEKNGGSYTVVNIGSAFLWGSTDYHFVNNHTDFGIIARGAAMAQAGLLDYNWNDTDSLPDPNDLCGYGYLDAQLLKEHLLSDNPNRKIDREVFVPARVSFGTSLTIDGKYISSADCIKKNAEGYDIIDPEKIKVDKSKGFEYCGYDFDLTEKSAVIYGNVTGSTPHGVKLYLEIPEDRKLAAGYYNRAYFYRRLNRVEVTDELFTPHVFHDSFLNIPLPEDMTEAEEILEYMKTPRDGCDFTVIDYHSITEEADGIYAQVRFKGRLEGLYSSDFAENDDGYVKTKII